MSMTTLTGSRVRERRLALGLKQADVARAAAVSASYLNLIEHNRRKIGGAVLARLAAVLGIEVRALDGGAQGVLVENLRAAAAFGGAAAAEVDLVEEFAGRFPGWAGAVTALHARAAQLERAVEALNDRMSQDPHLSAALHEVLSAASSVRSTAAILAETEEIAPEWRARFHANLHQDSERLAVGAEALVAYLDSSDEAEDGIAAPQEELEAWLDARGWHLAELEAPDGAAAVMAEVAALASGAARHLAQAHVARAAADAAAMPLPAFEAARIALNGDPERLARAFGVEVLAVFRRLAMRPGAVEGLVVCDGSGTLVFRKPADGFALPRFGAACPLWPLYTALSRPMSPVAMVVETAGRTGRRFAVQAFCQPRFPGGFGGAEVREAAMLILPDARAGAALPIGSTCRICPRSACVARREPSIVATGA